MSLYVDEYLATGEVPGPRHDILTGRYACYDVYALRRRQVARGRRDRAAVLREPVPRARLRAVARAPDRRRRAGRRSAPTSAPRSRAATATSGSPSSARPTPASRRSTRSPSSSTTRSSRARGRVRRRRQRPSTATFRQVGLGLRRAWTATQPPPEVRDAAVTDTDELLAAAGYTPTRSTRCATKEWSHERHVARRRRAADRRGAVRGDGRVPGRARLHLDDLRVGRERQPAVLGRRRSPRRSPAARSRRRRCSRSGSGRTTGRRAAPSERCRSRCTST